MSDDIAERWRGDADIMDLTPADLEEGRSQYTRVSDSEKELHVLLETVKQHLDLENWSQAADIALRVELAHAIDNYEIDFSREDYEIAYMIPPVGWLDSQEYERVDLVDDDFEDERRTIGLSTTETVHQMAKDAVDRQAYETVSEISKTGAKRILGRIE